MEKNSFRSSEPAYTTGIRITVGALPGRFNGEPAAEHPAGAIPTITLPDVRRERHRQSADG